MRLEERKELGAAGTALPGGGGAGDDAAGDMVTIPRGWRLGWLVGRLALNRRREDVPGHIDWKIDWQI